LQINDLIEIGPLLGAAIGATATLLGVSANSLFNLWLAKLNIEAQSRQKERELTLQKLEELFFLFAKWHIQLSTIYLTHLRCYRGQLRYEDVLDLTKSQGVLAPGEAQKYMMLINIYFPLLQVAYTPVEAARKNLSPFLSDPKVNRRSYQDFEAHQVAFERACEDFKKSISSTAQGLAPPQRAQRRFPWIRRGKPQQAVDK
jgi:hypothetical protein